MHALAGERKWVHARTHAFVEGLQDQRVDPQMRAHFVECEEAPQALMLVSFLLCVLKHSVPKPYSFFPALPPCLGAISGQGTRVF